MATVEMTVTLPDGRKFEGRIYRITGTKLGRDLDHLSFVAHLELQDDASHTAMAPILGPLDEYDGRIQEHITRILETVGVAYWHELVGKDVIALFDDGFVKGIASLDGSNVYVTTDTFADTPA